MKKLFVVAALFSAPTFAQQPQMPDLNAMFFQQFDRNQDGKVDKQEFLQPTEAQFDHMDANKDGALDASEVKAFNQAMVQKMQKMRLKMQQNPQGAPQR